MQKPLTNAGTHDSLIMIRVHTHVVLLQLECKLTKFAVFQLVFVQVRPTPDPRIYNMWKTLSSSDLHTKPFH